MTTLNRLDLLVIRSALMRAIDFEETSAQCWENEIKGYVPPDAKSVIATSRRIVRTYRQLDARIAKLLKRPRAKAGK